MGGGMGGRFAKSNDMYNNDVGKGVVYAYEAKLMKQNKGWRPLGRLFAS
jgi:hypothetical protein